MVAKLPAGIRRAPDGSLRNERNTRVRRVNGIQSIYENEGDETAAYVDVGIAKTIKLLHDLGCTPHASCSGLTRDHPGRNDAVTYISSYGVPPILAKLIQQAGFNKIIYQGDHLIASFNKPYPDRHKVAVIQKLNHALTVVLTSLRAAQTQAHVR